MTFVNYFQSFLEFKNITWYVLATAIVQFVLIIIIINSNDKLPRSDYFGVQWSLVCSSPIMLMTIFLLTFIAVMPRFIYLSLHQIVWFPEYAKIKGN